MIVSSIYEEISLTAQLYRDIHSWRASDSPPATLCIDHQHCCSQVNLMKNSRAAIASSNPLPVSSGVPQGSVIGPLLFIFYVNDISSVSLSNGTVSLFADDLLLYRPIEKLVDYQYLQTDIDSLCDWSDDNHLQFNGTKCKFMVISRKREPILPPQPVCKRITA